MSENTISAFGVQFYKGGKEDVLRCIDAWCDDSFSYVVTPNVNHVVRLRHDVALKRAYDSARIQLCDSRVLRILYSLLYRGRHLSVTPGSDLTADLLDMADKGGRSVAIVGASEEDIASIRCKYPNIAFFHHNPPMGFINIPVEVERCVKFVSESSANYVLLAVGSPRQELLAEIILGRGSCKGVGLCIGASVLFLSGGLKRAPRWVQTLCLEWLFRIMAEPKRLFGRYMFDAFGLVGVLWSEIKSKRNSAKVGRVEM